MGLLTILRDVWAARELLHQFVQRDIRLRYRQAVMGFAWALLTPALTIAAGLMLRLVLSESAGMAPSVGGIAIKGWAWAFFAGALSFGTISVVNNAGLVSKIYFPREVLPVASVVAQGIDSLIGLALLVVLGPWLHFTASPSALWAPVLVLMLVVLTMGLVLLLACANLFFRDVKYILQTLLTFGIFFTPVLFDLAQFGPTVETLLLLNPLSSIFEGLRLTLVEGLPLHRALLAEDGRLLWSPWWLAYSGAVAIGTLVFGMLVFRRGASFFAEYY